MADTYVRVAMVMASACTCYEHNFENRLLECGSPRAGLKQSYYTCIYAYKKKKNHKIIIIIIINDSQTYTHIKTTKH